MSLAKELNGEKKMMDFSGYTYVMVSTLKHFEFKEVVKITVDDSLYADNGKWDKNLQDVLGGEDSSSLKTDEVKTSFPTIDITFQQSEISNLTTIKNRLDSLKEKKVFWNITGGQRPFVLAIQQIAKTDDVICYLEGNKSQMVLLQNGNEIKDMPSYDLNGLNIETALKLMGFEVKETKISHRNLLTNHDETEKTFYLGFLEKYIKDVNLRKNCILLNQEDKKATAQTAIKATLKDLNYSKIDNELNRNKAFGYILEKLAGYKILEFAKDKIADITFGEKINFTENRVDEHHIDEFDIALLTKNGKFMIFECKSGGMDGDVAKSTKYSTYAVSGAYGLPILITPLLGSEINGIDKLDIDTYGYIQSAVKSAKRAGLEVWGVDEIETKLKKYIG